jgi:hypothetical protein
MDHDYAVSSGFIRTFNIDHPERIFDVHHNPAYKSLMFPPDLSPDQGCLCNGNGRDPLCKAEWLAVPYADFCRALGFDPRREVFHVGGPWDTEHAAVYEQGDYDLETHINFLHLFKQSAHFQNIRAQQGVFESMEDPFAWVDFARTEVLLDVGGDIGQADESRAFRQE